MAFQSPLGNADVGGIKVVARDSLRFLGAVLLTLRIQSEDRADDGGQQQQQGKGNRPHGRRAMSPCEFLEPVSQGRGGGVDRFVVQMAPEVIGQTVRCFVSPLPVLFQGFHHDPVEVTAHQAVEPGWFRSVFFGNGVEFILGHCA